MGGGGGQLCIFYRILSVKWELSAQALRGSWYFMHGAFECVRVGGGVFSKQSTVDFDAVTLKCYSRVNSFSTAHVWLPDLWHFPLISEMQLSVCLETGQGHFGLVLWLHSQLSQACSPYLISTLQFFSHFSSRIHFYSKFTLFIVARWCLSYVSWAFHLIAKAIHAKCMFF